MALYLSKEYWICSHYSIKFHATNPSVEFSKFSFEIFQFTNSQKEPWSCNMLFSWDPSNVSVSSLKVKKRMPTNCQITLVLWSSVPILKRYLFTKKNAEIGIKKAWRCLITELQFWRQFYSHENKGSIYTELYIPLIKSSKNGVYKWLASYTPFPYKVHQQEKAPSIKIASVRSAMEKPFTRL